MRYLAFTFAAMLIFASAACKPSPAPATSTATAALAQSPGQGASVTGTPVAAPEPAANAFTGAISETMNSGGYTYARLKSGADDVWIAGPEFDAKVGEQVSVSLEMPMRDFPSKTLNRTFPLLYFVSEVARNGQPIGVQPRAATPALMNSHDSSAAAVPVEKMAPPAGGLAIADVFGKKASLSGKPVTIRGKVVKFNGGIMDRNWLHLQDGSGSAEAHDNDLTITTDAAVKVGDVVTVTGVVGTGKDFGAGYAYDVIVEKATLAAK